ncbi:hypothetical protein Pelo_16095 [Pelomyxa schiedti]|nr:hypothetical protein Pelo_16095 [Pelomyxa schiedti]
MADNKEPLPVDGHAPAPGGGGALDRESILALPVQLRPGLLPTPAAARHPLSLAPAAAPPPLPQQARGPLARPCPVCVAPCAADPVVFPGGCGHVVCRGCYGTLAAAASLRSIHQIARRAMSDLLAANEEERGVAMMGRQNYGMAEGGDDEEEDNPSRKRKRDDYDDENNLLELDCVDGKKDKNQDENEIKVNCPVPSCGVSSSLVPDLSNLVSSAPEECMLAICKNEKGVCNPVSVVCKQCNMKLCSQCFTLRHERTEISSHKMEPLVEGLLEAPVLKCPIHGFRDLDLFCDVDHEAVCSLCSKSGGVHATHKCLPISSGILMLQIFISSSIAKLQDSMVVVNAAINNVEQSRLDIHGYADAILKNVDDAKAPMKQQAYAARRTLRALLSLIDSILKEQQECIDVYKSGLEKVVEKALNIGDTDLVKKSTMKKRLDSLQVEAMGMINSNALIPCATLESFTKNLNTKPLQTMFSKWFPRQPSKADSDCAPKSPLIERDDRRKLKAMAKELALAKSQVLTLQASVHRLKMREHVLNAKVIASTESFNKDWSAVNTLLDNGQSYASPTNRKMDTDPTLLNRIVWIVYDLKRPKRLTQFQMKNRSSDGGDPQAVKTFSLSATNTPPGHKRLWVPVLQCEEADCTSQAWPRCWRVDDDNNNDKYRYWRLDLLENNGATEPKMCRITSRQLLDSRSWLLAGTINIAESDTASATAANNGGGSPTGSSSTMREALAKLAPHEAFLRDPESIPRLMTAYDPAWLTRPYREGLYPLHIACKRGYVRTTRYLIDQCHCDVNITEKTVKKKIGMSPLHFACFSGHAYLAYILVKQYHADVNVRDGRWRTPLMWAVMQGHLHVVKVLVQNCNANPTLRHKYGDTPCEVAESTGHHDIAMFLVEEFFHNSQCKGCPQQTSVTLDELVTIPATGEELDDKTKLQLELTNQSMSSLEEQEEMPAKSCRRQIHSSEEGAPGEPMNSGEMQMSTFALRLVCTFTTYCGRSLLSWKDCLSCSQVCTIWRRQLSADDAVWIPHIIEEVRNAVRNAVTYMDETIPLEEKEEWKNATRNRTEMEALKTWQTTSPEKFCSNSKAKFLWVMRKKGRVPMPLTGDVPGYNPLIHDKWWSPRDVARFLWCYIWHYQWLGFFVQKSAMKKDSYDSKVLASLRNPLGVVGLIPIIILLVKCLSIPRKETDNNCALWPPDQNYISCSLWFSLVSAFILFAFSLSSETNSFYWFPFAIVIAGAIPFPSEWICFFRSITHVNPIFVAVASAVMLSSTFLFTKYIWKERDNHKSLRIGILGTIVGLIIWYDKFVILLRAGVTSQHLFLRHHCPAYSDAWIRHKLAMGLILAVIFILLLVILGL